jgi:hypothetical protein
MVYCEPAEAVVLGLKRACSVQLTSTLDGSYF